MSTLSHPAPQPLKTKTKPYQQKSTHRQAERTVKETAALPSGTSYSIWILGMSQGPGIALCLPQALMGALQGTIRSPSLAFQSVLSNFSLSHAAEPRQLRLGGHGMWQLHCQSLVRPTKGNEALKSHLHWCLVAQTRSFPESACHALTPFCSTLEEFPVESLIR